MTRISISHRVRFPTDTVWSVVADLESHPKWMNDAKWLVMVGDQRKGVGTTMRVKTVIGPFRTVDDMEIVGWVEHEHIEVRHVGLVKGTGRLGVSPEGDSTVVSWDEDLTFPWWLGGGVTAFLSRPQLMRVWSHNLRHLETVLNDL